MATRTASSRSISAAAAGGAKLVVEEQRQVEELQQQVERTRSRVSEDTKRALVAGLVDECVSNVV